MSELSQQTPEHWEQRLVQAEAFGGVILPVAEMAGLVRDVQETLIMQAEGYDSSRACIDALQLFLHAARPSHVVHVPIDLFRWTVSKLSEPVSLSTVLPFATSHEDSVVAVPVELDKTA